MSEEIYRRDFMDVGHRSRSRRYQSGRVYRAKRGGVAKPRQFVSFNARADDNWVVYRIEPAFLGDDGIRSCSVECWHRWAGEEVAP